jgi:hypothetical protein
MTDHRDQRRKVNFPDEGFLIVCDDTGLEIRVTDYHAEPLKVPWETIERWRSDAVPAASEPSGSTPPGLAPAPRPDQPSGQMPALRPGGRRSGVLLGFDPGGKGKFGWCVADDADSLPLSICASGLASGAREAVERALAAVPAGRAVLAAGIDAPLVWPRGEARSADTAIRSAIKRAGSRTAGGTVQSINSLRGACLAQGILVGVELRERFPTLLLTEAHPKALRWLSADAAAITAPTEDERDALLGAFSAWAAVQRTSGWTDLYEKEGPWFSPLGQPLHYFMPNLSAQ